MEDAKKLSEDVAKSTGEFMTFFTEKYISSTVGNKFKDRIKTTLTQGGKSKSDNAPEKEPEQESEQEPNKKDDDNKEAAKEENKQDNTESTEKDAENKPTEPPKEQDIDKTEAPPVDKKVDNPDDNTPDKTDDKGTKDDKDAPKKQENIKDEKKNEKKVEKQDTKDDTKNDTDAKDDDSKDDSKEAKAKDEEYTDYRPSASTGVYGSYVLTNNIEEKKEDDNDDDVKECVTAVTFPIIGSTVTGYEKGLIDGGGNEYNAFNILYYKLSMNDNNSCRFGIKLSRYSRIRDYHEKMSKIAKGKTNIKNLKFPSKSYAFWKKNDAEFLENRQKELNKYFMDSAKHEFVAINETFQIFLGLTPNKTHVNKMKVFNKSLMGTCNKMEYIRLPTNSELNRFNTEQDMLLYSIMIDVKDKTKDGVKQIIDKQPQKTRQILTNKINKLFATTVQKGVNESWKGIEDARNNVNEKLNHVLENNGEGFDQCIGDLIGKIQPIIEKKLGGKKDDDEKDDEKEEEKKDELLVEEIKSLNEFINKLTDDENNKSLNKLLGEYTNSYQVLKNKEKKGVISKYLYDMYQFEYGEYIKQILSKTYLNLESYKKYENDTQLICNASAELIQLSFEIFSNNLLLVFEAMDNNEENMNKLVTGIGENIANIIGKCDQQIVKELKTVESNVLALIVDAIGNLSGIFGNVLCCIINDCCCNENENEQISLKQSLINNLNKYIQMFVECVLNVLYKAVLCVLVTLVKNEIDEDVDKLLGDKLQFDWIPKGLPDSIPKDVLENVINVIVAYLLEKNMKKKRNALNSKICQTIRSN